MDRNQAEEDLKAIRKIMEQSTRYTDFSGLSGIIAGLLALTGCAATIWVAWNSIWWSQTNAFVVIWVSVLILAVAQNGYFANKKAKKNGERFFNPTSMQVIKAVLPGVAIAAVLSIRALTLNEWEAIPSLWTLGYGISACAAGMFSVSEVRIFGIAQLITGTLGLFMITSWVDSMFLMALSFGLYHIIFGFVLARKYGW
ncbi:MAG: hypothetical protein ACYC0V_06960 [Armatimonadota bacterium]